MGMGKIFKWLSKGSEMATLASSIYIRWPLVKDKIEPLALADNEVASWVKDIHDLTALLRRGK